MAELHYEKAAVLQDGELSLVAQAGIELYFSFDVDNADGLIFTGVRFLRTGDLRSIGYDGALPFGLSFSDSMDGAVARVGRHPDFHENDENDRCEYLHWNLDSYRLHLLFDSDNNSIARVTMLAQAPYYMDWDRPFEL